MSKYSSATRAVPWVNFLLFGVSAPLALAKSLADFKITHIR
jgi:hypothetical protein